MLDKEKLLIHNEYLKKQINIQFKNISIKKINKTQMANRPYLRETNNIIST